jgi:hypothetical protein
VSWAKRTHKLRYWFGAICHETAVIKAASATAEA